MIWLYWYIDYVKINPNLGTNIFAKVLRQWLEFAQWVLMDKCGGWSTSFTLLLTQPLFFIRTTHSIWICFSQFNYQFSFCWQKIRKISCSGCLDQTHCQREFFITPHQGRPILQSKSLSPLSPSVDFFVTPRRLKQYISMGIQVAVVFAKMGLSCIIFNNLFFL